MKGDNPEFTAMFLCAFMQLNLTPESSFIIEFEVLYNV